MEYQLKLKNLALEQGAEHAVPFVMEDIVFDPRTLLKCSFGCKDWAKMHTCPSRPNAISLEEYEKMLRRYKWGLVIHSHERRAAQKISLALERQAFIDGYYFVFSMSDCSLCTPCAGHVGEPCRFPQKARPAFHSVGIDVFATVRKFNLPINTLKDEKEEQQNWYAAIFVE